jgi:ribose transport system substrate-binding protein
MHVRFTRGKSRHLVAGLVGLAAIAIVLSGCSSSSSSGSSSNAPASGKAAAEVTAAQKIVDQYSKVPTTIALKTPLPAAPAKDKTIVWLQCDIASCAVIGQGISEAAKVLGWNMKTIGYSSANPATLVTGLQQALQYSPVAVALSGLPPAVWQTVLPAYKAAGVPILTSFTGPIDLTDQVPVNIYSSADIAVTSKVLASFLTEDSKGTGKALIAGVSAFPIHAQFISAIKSAIAKDCSGCSTTDLQATANDMAAGSIPQLIVSALVKDPSIKYVVAADSQLFDGLPSQLSAAGLTGKVKLIGEWTTKAHSAGLATGPDTAYTGLASSYTGWLTVDAAARLLQKAPLPDPSEYTTPTQLLTKSNAGTPSNDYTLPKDFPAQFEALWKVK